LSIFSYSFNNPVSSSDGGYSQNVQMHWLSELVLWLQLQLLSIRLQLR